MPLSCPYCRATITHSTARAGTVVTCPECRKQFPSQGDAGSPTPAADRTMTIGGAPASEQTMTMGPAAGVPIPGPAADQTMTLGPSPAADQTIDFDPLADQTMSIAGVDSQAATAQGPGVGADTMDFDIDEALPDVSTDLWSVTGSSLSGSRGSQSVSKMRLNDQEKEDVLLARALLDGQVIDLDPLNKCLSIAQRKHRPLDQVLVDEKIVTEDALVRARQGLDALDWTKGITDSFGNYTLIREGEQFVLHDRRQIRQFGKYEILGEIARGGMGVVYRARQVGLDRIIALKVLLASGSFNLEQILRFQREARTAANLNHPNIVPIFDVGEVDGEHYFTMEYVTGDSLSALIKSERQTPKRVLEIMHQVCEAIHYAHEKGIIHRDLKPGNIIFDRQGTPKVTDFGLAKEVEAESDLTHSGQMLGTPAYMAPEQALGEHDEVDKQSDVYALGAMLYEMLAGKRAFEGDNIPQLLFEIVTNDPEPLRKINPDLHPDLDLIAAKGMAKDKFMRYMTAGEMAADIGAFLEGRAISAEAPGRAYLIKRWIRRHKAVAATGAAGVAAILIISTILGIGLYSQSVQRAAAEAETRQLEQQKAAAHDARVAARTPFDQAQLYEKNGKIGPAVAKYRESIAADPSFDQPYLGLGLLYKAEGKLDQAVGTFTEAIEEVASSFNLYNERASVLRALDRHDAALADYDHLLAVDGANAEILFNRGLVHLDLGHYDAADADLAAAATARPDFVNAYYYRGIVAFSRGDLDASRQFYVRVVEMDAGHVDARYQLGRVLMAMERFEESLPHFDRLLEAEDELRGDVLRKTLSRRGIVLFLAGRFDEAADSFDRARAIDPQLGLDSDDRPLALQTMEFRAQTLAIVGRPGDAVLAARQLRAADPDSIPARALLVECLLQAGKLEDARAEAAGGRPGTDEPVSRARLALALDRWDEAVTLTGRAEASLEVDLLRAFALVGLGRTEEARALVEPHEKESPDLTADLYTRHVQSISTRHPADALWWARRGAAIETGRRTRLRAATFDLINRARGAAAAEIDETLAGAARAFLAIDPDHIGAHQILAGWEFSREDHRAALEHLDEAIRLGPTEAHSYLLRARVHRALTADLDALADLSTARSLDPGNVDVLFELGEAYYELEALGDARRVLDVLLVAEPGHAYALLYRALCRAGTGDPAGALDDLDRSLESEELIDARFNRAVLRIQAGRRDEAAVDLRRVLELDPEYPRARELLDRLGG